MTRSAWLLVLIAALTSARAEWTGAFDIGAWHARNNLADNPKFLENDGVGESYVDKDFSLFTFSLRADNDRLFDSGTAMHIDGRSLYKPFDDDRYTLGPEQSRYELRELSLEFKRAFGETDLWIGRQRIAPAGFVGIDGLRTVTHLNDRTDLGFFGGLGNNPRTYTGYIGPVYEANPFAIRFQSFGAYVSKRSQRFGADFAVTASMFDVSLDRVFAFSQMSYMIDPVWTVSGLVQAGFVGFRGLELLQTNVITKPSKKFTNTVSFFRSTNLVYNASNASVIPVGPVSDPALFGDGDVVTASYNTVREHFAFNVFEKSQVFGSIEYARRTFDDASRMKYTAGFREPDLFSSGTDLRLQTDLIDNYRGFNSVLDLQLGKEFFDGDFRLDGGVTLFSNERDVFANNAATGTRADEEEYTLRAMATLLTGRKTYWNFVYNLHREIDTLSDDQKVKIHEFFILSHLGF